MSLAEVTWSLGLLGLLAAAYLVFGRFRRRTSDYDAMRSIKQRLPAWASGVEKLALYGLTGAASGVVFLVFTQVCRAAGVRRELTGASLVFTLAGAILIAAPMGALLANGVSWLAPALRRANENAMSGSPISFASANHGLLWLGTALTPAGLVILAMATLAPWAGQGHR